MNELTKLNIEICKLQKRMEPNLNHFWSPVFNTTFPPPVVFNEMMQDKPCNYEVLRK